MQSKSTSNPMGRLPRAPSLAGRTIPSSSRIGSASAFVARRKPTRSQVSRTAFTQITQALSHDMPLVMHGSGDVQPSLTNPESVRLLSELTANYIANLVGAAIDAHEVLNDGVKPLPPPPLTKSRNVPLPSPPEPMEVTAASASSSSKSKKGSDDAKSRAKHKKKPPPQPKRKKRRRATDEFWDEPLPEPKIRNRGTGTSSAEKGTSPSKQSKLQTPSQQPQPYLTEFEGVDVDEWVGVAGVDFWDKARKAHVGLPAAMGTQCFLFPICHDGQLYGKVKDLQAARRQLQPIWMDPILQDVVRTEGKWQAGVNKNVGKGKKRQEEEEEEEEEPEETDSEGEDGPTWPGLESLLPVHRLGGFWNSMS